MPVDLAANPDLDRSNCFTVIETFRNISNREVFCLAFGQASARGQPR
jgi:hypothetical protein